MVPEESFRNGSNQVHVFAVIGSGGKMILQSPSGNQSPPPEGCREGAEWVIPFPREPAVLPSFIEAELRTAGGNSRKGFQWN